MATRISAVLAALLAISATPSHAQPNFAIDFTWQGTAPCFDEFHLHFAEGTL